MTTIHVMTSRVIATPATVVDHEPVDHEQVISGRPTTGVLEMSETGLPCGLWEHSTGTSSDVEVDEVFVVLSGRARIEIEGQDSLSVGPGDVVHLDAGARTVWHVLEPMRKFWVTAAD